MTALMPQAMTLEDKNIQDTLDLSESRAYDAALDILAAHKLTNNFCVNLEIVLRDIGAFDKVTYEIKPKSKLPYYPDYPDMPTCRVSAQRARSHGQVE